MNAAGRPKNRQGGVWMMKMRPIIVRIRMWPASMFAYRRTERLMSRMNCEKTSMMMISGRIALGTSGIHDLKYLAGPLKRIRSMCWNTQVMNARARVTEIDDVAA